MSESEREREADAAAASEAETEEYQVLRTPIDDVQPGQTIELRPEVAEAFDDNLIPADEEPPEEEGVRSQVVGQSTGPETLADLDEPIEAGEYEVYHSPIDDLEPGQVAHFEETVARAFADNLLPTDADAEAEAEGAPQSEDDDGENVASAVNSGLEDAQERQNAEDGNDDEDADGGSYDSPEEFLDQTVAEVRDDLEGADLTDEQLETLREAEVADDDRTGVKNAIDDHLED